MTPVLLCLKKGHLPASLRCSYVLPTWIVQASELSRAQKESHTTHCVGKRWAGKPFTGGFGLFHSALCLSMSLSQHGHLPAFTLKVSIFALYLASENHSLQAQITLHPFPYSKKSKKEHESSIMIMLIYPCSTIRWLAGG